MDNNFDDLVTESNEPSSVTVNSDQFPHIITKQINKLNELAEKQKNAQACAEVAKKSADNAKKNSVGWFNKGEIIEGLQSAGVDLADAVLSSTEAQKVSFEFQTQLAEISKYLFSLSAGSMAANRALLRELQLRLQNASEQEISELAKKELLIVVQQLKAQEDILSKQEKITFKQQQLATEINLLKDKIALNESEQSTKLQALQRAIDADVQELKNYHQILTNEVSFFPEQLVKVNNLVTDLQELLFSNKENTSSKISQLSDVIAQLKNHIALTASEESEKITQLKQALDNHSQELKNIKDKLKLTIYALLAFLVFSCIAVFCK